MNATKPIEHNRLARAKQGGGPAPGCDLTELLDRALTCIRTPSATQTRVLERLNGLRERRATERFQFAVLGQFKRGKSTVLNALLGQAVLPIGVVPVTAIPTFLEVGATIDVAAERIGAALIEADGVDTASIFSHTLAQFIAEPVAATLRSIEQTREALAKAMEVVASACDGNAPEELPKPTGMPMVDVKEISQQITMEKPRLVPLLGKTALASHVRRKLETEYDRAIAGVSESLRQSSPSLDGAEHQCAAQRVYRVCRHVSRAL